MSEDNQTLLLTNSQYVHIINNNTGVVRLIEGPYRGSLEANESIYNQIYEKLVLRSDQYCIILNPVKDGKMLEGEREVRKGPMIFSLYPGEIIEAGIQNAFSLAENQGLYIKNLKNGRVRLEIGPKEIFLDSFEQLYGKRLTPKEEKALGLPEEFDRYLALRIDLDEDEIIQLFDSEKTRYIKGPKTVFLKPFERPKVMNLSGSTPKRPGVILTAKVRLGPDFLSDILRVRTKDNAALKIHVRYKWIFHIDEKDLGKIYLINDFIGFASETIASEIRNAAAKHDFEDFHTNASAIIKNAIFSADKSGSEKRGRIFENGFEIFSVDIKQIIPEDPEIASKLNAAISNNMDVYVQKIQQTAELEARRQLIEGEKAIEEQRSELIDLKNKNLESELIEKATIEAQAEIEKAKGLAEAKLIREENLTRTEVERVKKLMEILKDKGSESYLKLRELQSFGNIERTIVVPSESKLLLPFGKLTDTGTLEEWD